MQMLQKKEKNTTLSQRKYLALFFFTQVVCVSLHPGTVNTNLSRPYHKNVPPNKLFSPEHSVNCLMNIIDTLHMDKTGRAYSWDGAELPW